MTDNGKPTGASRSEGGESLGADDFEEGRFFDIEFTVKARPLFCSEDPSEYVAEIVGSIKEGDADVGAVHAYLVEIGRNTDDGEVNVFDLFDSVDANLAGYAQITLEETWERAVEVCGVWPGQVLVLHSTQILPEYRGRRLGMWSDYRTIDTFGGFDTMVVAKPFPMQFGGVEDDDYEERMRNDPMRLREFEQDRKKALRKVTDYWKKMGYEEVFREGDDILMVLNNTRVEPKRRDVLGGFFDAQP
jgi:hypothetical protein